MQTALVLSLLRSSSPFATRPLLTRNFLSAAAVSSLAHYRAFAKSVDNPTQSCPAPTSTATIIGMASASSSSTEGMTGFLNAADAAALDVELMTEPGFSLEQLMELAGLSVAEAVYQVVEVQRRYKDEKPKILLVCGPGNNGGDGLVAARHLVMFGYDCYIVYPKQSKKQHFINLVQQCQDVGISISTAMPDNFTTTSQQYAAIVDAIFGFSFKGEAREPFKTILQQIKHAADSHKSIVTISVDVPSGWNVDEGDVAKTGFMPDVLISLTTPKHCSRDFSGRHFVGGRFLPPKLAEKYGVKMPPYPGVSQVMEVSSGDAKL